METTTTAPAWNAERGAALLAVGILDRATFAPTLEGSPAHTRRGNSPLDTLVALCRRAKNKARMPYGRSNESNLFRNEADSPETLPSAPTAAASNLLLLFSRCGDEPLIGAVMKSIAVLVGVNVASDRLPAATRTARLVASFAKEPADCDWAESMSFDPDANKNKQLHLFKSPALPPLPAGDADGNIEQSSTPWDKQQCRPSLPALQLPPLPPPPLTRTRATMSPAAVTAIAGCTDLKKRPLVGSTDQRDNEKECLPRAPSPMTTVMIKSSVVRIENSPSAQEEMHSLTRGSGYQSRSKETSKIDKENSQRVLLGGVLRLILELFEREEGRQGEGRGGESLVREEGKNSVQACAEEEMIDLVWDIIIEVLGNSWSEIREMAAAHARSLAMTFGSGEARALYLKASARCNDSLLLPESENNQPRQWKRMHGLLLGMCAAVEGAAAAAASESVPAAAVMLANGNPCHTKGPISFPAEIVPRGLCGDTREGRDESISSTKRNATLEETSDLSSFAADVVIACDMTLPSTPTSSPPPSSFATSHSPEPPPSAPVTATLGHQAATLVIHPSDPPKSAVVFGVDVAFRCLSHRQAVVREAAVGLLHAQAVALGPRAALTLYRRTVQSLEPEGDHETSEKKNTENVGNQGDQPTKRSYPLRGAVESRFNGVAPGGTKRSSPDIDRGADGAARIGTKKIGIVIPQAHRAETRRSVNRVGGLLDLLGRIVGQPEVLPRGTVGNGWEHLFSVLRFYMGHPETSLRQTAGVVLIRIATTTRPTSRTLGTEGEDPACRRFGGYAHHTSARIVLWALLRGSLRQRQLLIDGWTDIPSPARRYNSNSGNAGRIGGGAGGIGLQKTPSWELREGMLLVYDGVLKCLVEGHMAKAMSGKNVIGNVCDRGSPPPVAAAAMIVDQAGVNVDHNGWGWSAEIVRGTPPLAELLVLLRHETEDALHEAELVRWIHCDNLPHQTGGVDGGDHSTTVNKKETLPGAHQQQQQASGGNGNGDGIGSGGGGSIELWRAGSQLLPSLARALLWWKPKEILGLPRASLTSNRACEGGSLSRTKNELGAGADVESRSPSAAGVPWREQAQLLSRDVSLLREQTSISVACEILSASIRHARHLAEILSDRTAAGLDGDGVGGEREQCARTCVTITGRERWGNSSDGIEDTSGGGGMGISKVLRGSSTGESGIGSKGAKETAGATAKDDSTARKRDPSVFEHVVARIILVALSLARDAPPLLARALANFSGNRGMLPDRNQRKMSENTPHCQAAATTSSTSCGDRPASRDTAIAAANPLPERTTFGQWNDLQWVLTGVVEALVLMETFRATTILHAHPSLKTRRNGSDTDWAFGDGGYGEWMSDPSALLSLSSPPTDDGGVDDGVVSPSQKGINTPRTSTMDTNWQASSSQVESGRPEYNDHVPSHFWLVQRQLQLLHHEVFRTECSEGGTPSTTIPVEARTTAFVIPFCWGSLSLLHLTIPFGERDKNGGTNMGDACGDTQMQDQHNWRLAVRLDRLLSARIVHALPGYVGGLPPQRCIGIIPSLIRWLEAGDHNVRWISVSPMEAHTSLLLAIGIALQKSSAARKSGLGQSTRLQEGTQLEQGANEGGGDEELARKVAQETAQGIGPVVSALASTLTRLLTEGSTRGVAAMSLFPQMCAVARDVVDLLLMLVQQPCVTSPPTKVDNQMPMAKRSHPPSSRVTPFAKKQHDETVESLLRSVADYVMRWYPEYGTADVGNGLCQNRGSVLGSSGVGDGGCVRVWSSGAVGFGSGGVGVGGGDGDGCGGRGSEWDDWDDDEEDDGPRLLSNAASGSGRTLTARKSKANEIQLLAVLRSTAALVSSAEAYYLAVAVSAGSSAARTEQRVPCTPDLVSAAVDPLEDGTATGNGRQMGSDGDEKQCMATSTLPSCSSETGHGRDRRSLASERAKQPIQEAKTLVLSAEGAVRNTTRDTADVDAAYDDIADQDVRNGQQSRSTTNLDRGSSTGLPSVPPTLKEVFDRLPSEHRQVLLWAWLFSTAGTPA